MKSDEEIIWRLIYDVRQTLTVWERKIVSEGFVKYFNRYTISDSRTGKLFLDFIIYDVVDNVNFPHLSILRVRNDKTDFVRNIIGGDIDILIETIKISGNYYTSD